MTQVKFLAYTDEDGIDIYAVFSQIDRTTEMLSYSHVGQHSAASKGYIAKSRAATAEEYADLLTELQGIYDNLVIV